MTFSRPRIVISRCLEFDSCRYNGDMIPNKFIRQLMEFVDFIPICPEEEIGLGTPRDPIRLVGKRDAVELIQPSTERNLTREMNEFSTRFLSNLEEVDGFVLKAKSPSCGIKDVKVYPRLGNVSPAFSSSGVFAQKVQEMFPDSLIEKEVRFNDIAIREHWLTAVFTMAEFRLVSKEAQMGSLVKFQTRHKLLFMACNQTLMRKLGRIAANPENLPVGEVIDMYRPALRGMFNKKPRFTSNINVLMHAFGYFSDNLSREEKGYFLELLESYRANRIPLSVLNHLMLSWILRFDEAYLQQQSYFQPFPETLGQPIEKRKR